MNHARQCSGRQQQTKPVGDEQGKGMTGSKGKLQRRLLRRRRGEGCALLLLSLPLLAQAAPSGGQVSAGSGSIAQNGALTTITQQSDRLAIDWQQFNIGAQETVTFQQPSRSSIALNRVLGQSPSEILGKLNANGQVFLLNPNGVLFGQSAQVNVGGLVASSLNLSNSDFLAGRFQFDGNSQAQINNQGLLQSAAGGYVALLGASVDNSGSIVTPQGNTSLAAGQAVTLQLDNGSLVGLTVDKGAVAALVNNGGLIQAADGQVLLTAKAADQLSRAVVNHSGVIEAGSVSGDGGSVYLLADMAQGQVKVAGKIDVSARSGAGGFVETSGAQVQIDAGADISSAGGNGKDGTWLIDPTNFTIAAGNGAQTTSGMGVDTLAQSLESGSVIIVTSDLGTDQGDILLQADLAWNSGNTLTLNADHDIQLDANVTAASGGLVLHAVNAVSASGNIQLGSFTLQQGSWVQTGSLPIFNATDFRLDGGSFLRVAGGDGSNANPWQLTDIYGLQGIDSLLAGNDVSGGHWFQLANDVDASGTSGWNGGAGFNPIGNDTNLFVGDFDGQGHVISHLLINRQQEDAVGLFGRVDHGQIRRVGLADGSITGRDQVGALVGDNAGGDISAVWSSSQVQGRNKVGGLIGYHYYLGQLDQSYASGNVSGSGDEVGGLVGNNASGSITNAYATGAVSGNQKVGGLVGSHNLNGTINFTYATGLVSGNQAVGVGGLVGEANSGAQVQNSFWDRGNSGQSSSAGGTGVTSADLMNALTYGQWALDTNGRNAEWHLYAGLTRPLLRTFMTPLGVTLSNQNVTYNGSAYDGAGLTWSPVSYDASRVHFAAVDAGNYDLRKVLYSDQHGYDIAINAAGTLTIDPKTLLVIGTTAVSRDYDGTQTASLTGASLDASGIIGSDEVSLADATTGTFASKDVGNGIAVATHMTLTGAKAGNYRIDQPQGLSANIAPATLTLTANDISKVYGGVYSFTGNEFSSSGLANGETVGSATLSSNGAVAGAGVTGGPYTISITQISGGSIDPANYNVIYQPGNLMVTPAPLTITALDDVKVFDGLPYQGGKGVSYAGFVNGDDALDLSGSLVYGGTSQGAVQLGNYTLLASGLSGSNYAITYVDGNLLLRGVNPLEGGSLMAAYESSREGLPPVTPAVAASRSVTPELALASAQTQPTQLASLVPTLTPVEQLQQSLNAIDSELLHFPLNEATLMSVTQLRDELRPVAELLRDQPQLRLVITGFTDNTGSERRNERLSQQRAEIVAEQLGALGVLSEQLQLRAGGTSRPVADNATASGRAANRRVELTPTTAI